MVPAGELCGAEGPGPVQHVHGREGDRQRQDQVGQGCTQYRGEGFLTTKHEHSGVLCQIVFGPQFQHFTLKLPFSPSKACDCYTKLITENFFVFITFFKLKM